MKLRAGDIERFVKQPPAAMRAALVFGPESSLVRDRATALAKSIVDDLSNPFRVASLTGSDVSGDPARLADEAAQLSMLGGRRLVRVRDAGDSTTAAFASLFELTNWDAFVVVEAGDLGTRAKLVKLFDEEKTAASIACYAEGEDALEDFVAARLKEAGVKAANDLVPELTARLPADRTLIRREIEKLALYTGGETLTLDGVEAVIAGGRAADIDDVIAGVANGDLARLDTALARSLSAGESMIGVLRQVSSYLMRLHAVALAMKGGATVDAAMARAKVFLPFSLKPAFERQARAWTPDALERALGILLEAERACKRTGAPEEALTSRALLSIASLVRARNLARA